MSNAATQAAAFYREVALTGLVWTIKDSGGFPAPTTADGNRAMPFWSSELRTRRVIVGVAAYHGFDPVPIDWVTFCERWIPGLENDGFLVGVNWSGHSATGYDVKPSELRRNVEAARNSSDT